MRHIIDSTQMVFMRIWESEITNSFQIVSDVSVCDVSTWANTLIIARNCSIFILNSPCMPLLVFGSIKCNYTTSFIYILGVIRDIMYLWILHPPITYRRVSALVFTLYTLPAFQDWLWLHPCYRVLPCHPTWIN